MNSAAALEKFLHEKIPLTVSMGVQVTECNDQQLILTAPLEPNHNHLGTAFGGSLHALATLSGYGLLWWLLREPEAHIVIRESTIRYERPVHDVLRAVCSSPPAQEMERFRKDFGRKGKARIALEAAIVQDNEIAAYFRATFVAIGDRS
ncbi:thioesterase domain protein [Chthoniobacter flavus Ellin428]|uniref:Thioesterase domain protein n=1 Tax=Chthoniobacter flavus Ellin428 TaxID=497964 RepID=B4D4G0_9BACT|nr:YiiD C-terminal domain-containing protein [Chthoniobacter flavus]EDY18761.1 thioesterase domain protein [Chthoniobacter flavus Ellin428]TCO88999.1 thioesterase domain-containing protein [Chthoniobacter flavus]